MADRWSNPSSPIFYPGEVAADDPLGWWRLGESSGQPQDSSGNANHTTAVGGTPTYGQASLVPTSIGNNGAILFDGATEYFSAPDHVTLDWGDVVTFEAWLSTSTGTEQGILTKGSGGGIYVETGGNFMLAQPGIGIVVSSTVAINNGTRHHVVATKNGATSKLYVDGVDRTGTVSNLTFTNNTSVLMIGAENGPGGYFNGTLDEVAVYGTALSAERVLAHYNAGIQGRFRVWPLGVDKYDHVEFAANWDKVDAIFGGPEAGSWPEGGVYQEIKRAQDGAIPLGTLFPWFRPSLTVPFPTGYVVADGSTLTVSQHSFPGGGNVTIPDLRNRFVLGADYDKTIGLAASDVESDSSKSATGAPGPQGVGGSNAISIDTKHLPAHSHTGSYTGWSPAILTWYYQNSTYAAQQSASGFWDRRDEAIEKCGLPGCWIEPERTAPIYPKTGNFDVTLWGNGVHYSAGDGGYQVTQHRHSLSSISASGSDAVHENRPRYIGLIWLIKVKNG